MSKHIHPCGHCGEIECDGDCVFGILEMLAYHGEGPTGCADDALPGTADDWRNAIRASQVQS